MLTNAMPRIGTNTNSNDPQSLRSRVFVGNIDPTMSRDEIESIFQRYGSVSALSVHKGFAFVQYNDELSARAAVFGENNKKYHSKYLDCNVASEPKPNRKRAHNYNSSGAESCSAPQVHPYLAATAQALAAQHTPPVPQMTSWPDYGGSSAKFSRVGSADYGGTRASNLVSLVAQSSPAKPRPPIPPMVSPVSQLDADNPVEKASTKDILICGCCKGLFDNYDTLINHKAQGCRLRFICRCKQMGEPKSLTCSRCFVTLRSSWELVLHHINVHGASLFVDEERYSQPVATPIEETKEVTRSEIVKRERPQLANGEVTVDHAARKTHVEVTTRQSTGPASRETNALDQTVAPNACDSEEPPVADNHGDGEIVDLSADNPSVLRRSSDSVDKLEGSDETEVTDRDTKTCAVDGFEKSTSDPELKQDTNNHDDEVQLAFPDEATESDDEKNQKEKEEEEKMDGVENPSDGPANLVEKSNENEDV